ncbi:hypothetical protein HWV62_35394 [Athelia sp. TMB]|nr:hypothetical protein HWV62_35394 [Athelia sp. TMB]
MAPLDSHLDDQCSASDLEQAVLQRLGVEEGWTSKHEKPSFMLTAHHEAMQRTRLHLVEGGRWLLASTNGAIAVYDLIKPQEKGQMVVPPPAGSTGRRITSNLSVDILRDAPTLTFNVAIAQDDLEPDDPDDEYVWTHFWRFTMQGHGISAKLQATFLNSFRTIGDMMAVNAVCLGGSLYARAMEYLYEGSCVEVYSWEDSGVHLHLKAVFPHAHQCDYIRLLPNNRVLILAEAHIDLYGIPAFETVPSSTNGYRGSKIASCNSLILPGTKFFRGAISPLLFEQQDQCKFTCSTNEGIFVVTISPSFSSACMIRAFKSHEEVVITDVVIGIRRVYIRHYAQAELWSYDIDQPTISTKASPPKSTSRQFITDDCPSNLTPVMDESSGRVAMAGSNSSLAVFYYSLFDRVRSI